MHAELKEHCKHTLNQMTLFLFIIVSLY